jgi:asparagine synthase (glutamine-hydrolysing)
MCGIFFLKTDKTDDELSKCNYFDRFNRTKHRGPDYSSYDEIKENTYVGFHRLCINDLSELGNQPFVNDNIYLICNGEIYNHKILSQEYNISTKSDSDCEVILHLYKKLGIYQTVRLLDGVFAFVLVDYNKHKVYIARDMIGVRPMYISHDKHNLSLASEAKSVTSFGEISQFPAGKYAEYDLNTGIINTFDYFQFYKNSSIKDSIDVSQNIKELLEKAIDKRLMTDRPIGCLLSGGLDSSVVASILQRKLPYKIKTFSIGFKDSVDLKYARKVAGYISSDHYEYVMTHEEALNKIPEVIKMIETDDITTIRASVGMYILSEYIKENFKETVIFSGEGADELLCGYLYFHNAPDDISAFQESKRLLEELPEYDVLRADRSTASHGLELRVPFLDSHLVNYCTKLDGSIRRPQGDIEKYYLRNAFQGYIPDEVLWRRKDGFSDGVSGTQKPWYQIIQEHVENQEKYDFISKEASYYSQIFHRYYDHIAVEKYWMPRWVDNTTDPSGRLVNIKKKED